MDTPDNHSHFSRSQRPAAHYDAVILGGGINGAGVFRDLSLQGLNCLLVGSGDFCAAASADVLFRRTDIALSGRLTPDVAREVAMIGAQALGWDARRVAEELSHVTGIACTRHRIAGFDRPPIPERASYAQARDLTPMERQL